jgi:hypothetical protein
VTSASYSATEPSVLFHYISIPVLWRNYYTMLGYFRNKPTGELWLEPMIPPEMEHSIKNGFFMSPEGFGTISATETGADFANQEIMFKPDRPIAVTTLYFRDKSTDSVRVFINSVPKPVLRIGEGYARELKVDFSGTIDSSGIAVNVLYGNSGARNSIGQIGNRPRASIFANVSGRVSLPQSFAGERVSISLFSLTGELIGRKVAQKADIDIRKEFKISNGFTIVQIMPIR